jgi:predicted nuclease of predicted toxin-antitoxin system
MSPGISDNEVFGIANRENAVLLTADRDLGRIS